MPLIFDNPDDDTQPLFYRLQAAATGNLDGMPTRIDGDGDLYTVRIRLSESEQWIRTGSANEIVDAFKKMMPTRD